jgi:hypothetical protein
LASWNPIQGPAKKIQERTTQRRGTIDPQERDSETNELKAVNRIRYVSAPITCQKNTPFKTTVQID